MEVQFTNSAPPGNFTYAFANLIDILHFLFELLRKGQPGRRCFNLQGFSFDEHPEKALQLYSHYRPIS